MSDPAPQPAAPSPREIIHCAKCDTENLAGATRCHECGAHLYLACPVCQQANLRHRRLCAGCGARLGRGGLRRLKDKVFRRFSLLETSLGLVALAALIFLLIRLVAALGSVEPEPEEEPEYDHTVPSTDPAKPPPGTEPAPGPG